jgi:hypothetical protein
MAMHRVIEGMKRTEYSFIHLDEGTKSRAAAAPCGIMPRGPATGEKQQLLS